MIPLNALLGEVMAAESEKKRARERHMGFHDSGHPCSRKLYFDLTEGPGEVTDLRSLFTQAVGHAVGEMLENAARRLGCETQVPVTLQTVHLVSATGHADIVADDEVVDVKVVGESSWQPMLKEKAPKREHVQQVNGYACAKGKPRWSLYYLRGISIFIPGELEWRVFRGNASAEQAGAINERWEYIDSCIKRGMEPAKPKGYRRDSFPCGWCGHQSRCYST